jgi:hypothetical protein
MTADLAGSACGVSGGSVAAERRRCAVRSWIGVHASLRAA